MTDEVTQGTPTETAPVNSGNTSTPVVPQDTVNKLVGQARVEGKQTALTELLKELGVESKDALAALLKGQKEREEAEKTAEQRALEALESERKKASAYEEQIRVMQASQRTERRDNAVRFELRNAHDDEAVLEWLRRETNKPMLEKVLTADGSVDKDAAKAAVEKARKDAPYLFKSGSPGSPSNAGGNVNNLDERKKELMKQPPELGL